MRIKKKKRIDHSVLKDFMKSFIHQKYSSIDVKSTENLMRIKKRKKEWNKSFHLQRFYEIFYLSKIFFDRCKIDLTRIRKKRRRNRIDHSILKDFVKSSIKNILRCKICWEFNENKKKEGWNRSFHLERFHEIFHQIFFDRCKINEKI